MKALMTSLILLIPGVMIGLAWSSSNSVDENPTTTQQQLQDELAKLKADVKRLQEMSVDQAAVMSHLSYHWSNLWTAIQQENWQLADFYLAETRSNLNWAIRVRPIRKVGTTEVNLKDIGGALDGTQFAQMKEAIFRKDKDRCIKLYTDSLQGCYACHKASDKPYLRPQIPTGPESRVINFDPRATEPR